MSDRKTEYSSISVEEHGENGLVVHHFTGVLLMSRYEASHLRALLDGGLVNEPMMSVVEAKQIVDDRDRR